MELQQASELAEKLKELLGGSCTRIEVAGSIRRRRPDVGDIELLCIPDTSTGADQLDRRIKELIEAGVLALRMGRHGRKVYGPKNKLLTHVATGFGVDVFSTDEACWPVAMVVRTGGKATCQRIAVAAQERGYSFHAYGTGFTTPEGMLVCYTEEDVFKAVGLPYKDPWERS